MEERNVPDERIGAVRARATEDVSFLLAQRREAEGEENSRRGRAFFQLQADTLGLFVELYDNAIRDAERRPAGNIEAHASGRLAQTYMALKLIEAARDLGLLPEDGKLVATRAMVQDKRGSSEFPAAHRLPADLAVEMPDGSRRRLPEYLGVALNRVAVDREVFSRTDRLSRMANVVDSWLEAAGMRKTLARAANAVATGSQSAGSAMAEIVEPGYAAAVTHARRHLDRNMAIAERTVIATAIVDTGGDPFRAMRDDLRLRTADLENRARAKAMMDAVLAETARHRYLNPEQCRIADEFIRGIADNERNLGARRSPDWNAARSAVLVPARNLPDLTESEITDRLHGSSRLAGKRAEIENLSRLVFGNSQAVSASLDGITDARSGAAAGDDVRIGGLGDMAGRGRTWLRAPSPERQTAEANVPRLVAALADYGLVVDFERHQIVTQHREEQARQRVEIPRPSAPLMEVLGAERQEQGRRLNADPTLRRELESLTLAITKRLSPAEKTDLKDGNAARLASSLGISPEQGITLRGVHDGVRVVQERAIRQDRDLSRANQLNIRR